MTTILIILAIIYLLIGIVYSATGPKEISFKYKLIHCIFWPFILIYTFIFISALFKK